MSGPRNMMTVRVRRAASTSMRSRSSCAGGSISRSLLSGSHRTLTPIEVSTSRMRLTSSIQGFPDAGDHLEREVLLALLDPRDRALACRQQAGELALGEPLVSTRIADESADALAVVVRHERQPISSMR